MGGDSTPFAVPMLDGTNYATWSVRAQAFLAYKGYWESIGTDPPEPITAAFTALDAKTRAFLTMSVADHLLPTVARCTTAKEAWTALETVHAPKSTVRKVQLRTAFASLKQGTAESATAYINRAKALRDDLAAAGHSTTSEDLATQVLAGLSPDYTMVKAIIENTTTAADLDVDDILPRLLPYERGASSDARPSRSTDTAFMAHPSRPGPILSRRPGFTFPNTDNHTTNGRSTTRRSDGRHHRSGPSSSSSHRHDGRHGRHGRPSHQRNAHQGPDRANNRCFWCHETGHWASECTKKDRYMDDMRARTGTNATPHRNANRPSSSQFSAIAFTATAGPYTTPATPAAAAYTAPPTPVTANHAAAPAVGAPTGQSTATSRWIVDTGATKHITADASLLSNLRAPDGTTVTFGNGGTATPAAVGDAYIKLSSGTVIKLTDVLHVPTAADNLMSVAHASKSGATFTFDADTCRIAMGPEIIAMLPAADHNIYYLSGSPLAAPNLAHAATTTDPNLWHRRLGHLGLDNLAKLTTMSTGIKCPPTDIKGTTSTTVCKACALGKQHRQPFPPSTNPPAAKPLELLHTDICGPMPTESHGGNRYFMTAIDDHTSHSWTFFLRHKSDAGPTLIDFITQVQRQTGATVRRIRSDNGGEYTSAALADFYTANGIKPEFTVPYNPEMNGKAERLNLTLLEKARTMLIDANMPPSLWAEAIATANYLRNRSPTAGSTATPHERLHGTKPDLSHLRVFGCRAYAHVPAAHRTKLEPTAEPGHMIGYAANSAGYKIRLDNGSIITARNVVFDESTAGRATPAPPRPKPHILIDTDDTESVGAEPEHNPPSPPAPRRPQRAAAGRPAHMWQDNAYRITGRTRAATAIASIATTTSPPATPAEPPKLSKPTPPATLDAALASPDAYRWREAIDDELQSLLEKGTYTLEPLPPGAKAIPCKWVFDYKLDAAGAITRYKARLVAKGFRQREGIDYTEVFAPVSKYTTLRALLALAAGADLELHQLDIKTAFLNGNLSETIYIEQPPGYSNGDPTIAGRLHKSIYGLKQASRTWYETLAATLINAGYKPSTADPSLFISPSGCAYLLVYVDDVLIAAPPNSDDLTAAKTLVLSSFEARDLGAASLFLGMLITRDRAAKTIKLSQPRHIADLLAKFQMTDAKPYETPSSAAIKLTAEGEPLDTVTFPYSNAIGSLMYIASCTRPDIAQAVGALARYMAAPTTAHWTAVKHILRYLAGTPNYGITYGPDTFSLAAYCDASYAGCLDTRRSTTGYVFILNGGAITWSSRLQSTVAVSTTEAEYMAAAAATKEALWLRTLFADLGLPVPCIDIAADNQAAISLLKNPIISLRSKHIDVLHHFARERVARGEVTFTYVPTDAMAADALTKPVPATKHKFCRASMGIS